MDRREAIKRTALLMGGAVLGPTALGLLSGCKGRPGVDWKPEFFTPAQAQLVTALSDIILPADEESPGAAELGVPAFIEQMLLHVHDERSRRRQLEGLEAFDAAARSEERRVG